MTRICRTRMAAALLILALAGSSMAAEKTSALAQVPKDARIVVYVRGWEGAREHLVAMLRNALPYLEPQLETKINAALEEGMKGRHFKGMPKDGACFFVLSELPAPPKEPQKLAFVVQVNSFDAFLTGLLLPNEVASVKHGPGGVVSATMDDKETYFVDLKGFVAFTPSKEMAQAFVKGGPGLDKAIPQGLGKRLLASDVALFVDMAAVNAQYGPQIKQVREKFEKGIEQANANVPPNQKNYVEFARQLFEPVFQGIEESNTLLVTANFEPQGLRLHAGLGFKKDTKTAEFLKTVKSSKFEDLGQLPPGAMGYVGIMQSKELFGRFMPMVFGLVMDFHAPEGMAIQQAIQEMAAAGPGATAASFCFPLQGVSVAQYADPQKAVEAQLKIYKAMQGGTQFQGFSLKSPPVLEQNVEIYRGFKFHHVSMMWDFEKGMGLSGSAVPEDVRKRTATALYEMMGHGINTWFGTDGKVFLTLTAKDWGAAKTLADEYLNQKMTPNPAFTETRKHLPSQAVVVYLLDVPRFGSVFSKMFFAALPQGGPNIHLAEPSGKPSYVGFAATARPQQVGFDVFVPVTTVQEIRKMIEPMLKR